MLDHIGIRVSDLAASRRFYEAVARPLGLEVADNTENSFLIWRSPEEPAPFIWVGTDEPSFWTASHVVSASPIHIALTALDREQVDLFHMVGLANGGLNNGKPGWRGPKEMNYYAAFLIDPDGNNIEAGYRG